MSQSKLILSQTPSISVPLRFFLMAPLFGIAAPIVILAQGEIIVTGRWAPGLLACTHLLVLGYLGMVMQGALLQVVSVLTGGRPPHVHQLGGLAHALLTLGTILLAFGFLVASPQAMSAATLLLGFSFLIFIGTVIAGLLLSQTRHDAGAGISLALGSLVVAIGLGVWLAMGYGWEGILLTRHLTDTHLVWGLLGWGGILLVTVAYEVVPMFQLTPSYPVLQVRYLSFMLIVGLITWSGGDLAGLPMLALFGGLLCAFGLASFAVVTLWLQNRRKRKQPDATVWFWRCAMFSLLAAILLWLTAILYPELSMKPYYPLLLGVLLIYGFLISAVNGMLYKILPFLAWLHLSIKVTEHKLSRRIIPNIRKIILDAKGRFQFWLHLATLLLMVATIWRPVWFLIPLSLVMAASNILLWKNLFSAFLIFKKTWAEIETSATASH